MDQEERRGGRIAYQSEKSIVDWIKKSRLEQAAHNKEIKVERSKQILKERYWRCTGNILFGKENWRAATETSSPGSLWA